MGYELNRLMGQFGVSRPSLAYSGTAIPVAPAALAADATAEQKTAFDTAQANYGTHKTAYDADRALFDKYKVDYQGRLENTPMYSQAQFQTRPSDAVNWATSSVKDEAGGRGIGMDRFQQNIRDYASQNAMSTPAQLRAQMDKYGVSGYDVAQARGGSMWGAPLAMPTYQNYMPPVVAHLASAMPSGAAMPSGEIYLTPGYGGSAGDAASVGDGDSTGNAAASAAAEGSSAGADGGAGGTGIGEGGGTGMGGWARGGTVRRLAQKYQVGGIVRRFQEGGKDGEDMDPMEAFLRERSILNSGQEMPAPAVTAEPAGLAPVAAPAAPAAPAAAMPEMMGGDRNAQLMGMLSRYFPQGDEYGAELKAARAANTRESEAFQKMLQDAIKQPRESGPDKAEMYFRLAAAFGAPTKTGHFAESLGKVGEATAGIQKERRESASADRARKLQLGLEAQKLRMAGAKEDLATVRQLAAEGMKDKRTIATELIKEYVKSGQPQSSAGKQAMDEGLKPNTPEFQARVAEIAELNVDRQMAQINATLANMGVAQANAALQGQKFQFQQEQAAKLTAPEMKLKTETEDLLAQTAQGYQNIKRALELNPKTFDTSLIDTAQRKALEAVGSKDPKVANTRELENMLEKAALSQLKATFPGAISNDERNALLATQGMSAKSIEERGRIMQNAANALKGIYARNKKRLNEINQGAYRATQIPGDE